MNSVKQKRELELVDYTVYQTSYNCPENQLDESDINSFPELNKNYFIFMCQ